MKTSEKLSGRLKEIVNALPLKRGMRILEIGCGPGVMAREIANRFEDIYVLAIDRSAKAIQQAKKNSGSQIETGKLSFVQIAVEHFVIDKSEPPFDLAVAIRVGAFDGRHPEIEQQALKNVAAALTRKGKFFIDGGNPLREISLKRFHSK
ncbi:MAG: class I SAM-dependent methyltransferase [Chitinophagaceae bacterium]|nr:MAG: class I SAM-dependent methyltransferase [Chitinophagaceae bacterium]